mmetsp:Transcript_36553/g.85450  ORF Transcript_36553/g.85450 Transcript_36553/m.85450 type:complete len:591 (-) Transcript_36553:197-1969(-)
MEVYDDSSTNASSQNTQMQSQPDWDEVCDNLPHIFTPAADDRPFEEVLTQQEQEESPEGSAAKEPPRAAAEEPAKEISVVQETPPKRLRAASRQSTLTQQDAWVSPEPQRPSETSPRPRINGNLFDKGETWRSERDAYLGYFFRISSFRKNEKGQDCAVCGSQDGVKISLGSTFVGETEAARIREKWGERGELAVMANPNNVRLSNGALLLDRGKIPLECLKTLEQWVEHYPPPILLYEASGTPGTPGYTVAYRRQDGPPLPTPLLSENQPPAVLALFSGCGGLELGFREAGFAVAGFVDICPHVRDTLRVNFPNVPVFKMDVHNFLDACAREDDNVYPRRCEIQHINSGCPCQGFSAVNTGDGVNDEHHNRLVHAFTRAVAYFRPHTAVFENVPGILVKSALKTKLEHLQRVFGDALMADYQLRLQLADAGDYGDPQRRVRVIVLFVRKGLRLPEAPPPTHGEGRRPRVTAEDALGDLADRAPTECGLVELVCGTVVADHEVEGTHLPADPHSNAYLLPDVPARTVRKKKIKHYARDRFLTVRELARLQSFPDHFRFAGTYKEKCRQIGNAVPIRLSRAIAKTIMTSYH